MATKAWYNGKILPGVQVAGHDVGGLTVAEARAKIQGKVAAYRIKLDIAAERYELTAAQLGVRFDAESTLKSAYSSGRSAWLPPLYHQPVSYAYRLNRGQLNAFTRQVSDKVGTPPVDAGVVVQAGKLTTTPEKSGWSIDRLGLQRLIEADVSYPGGHRLALKPREQLADIQSQSLAPTIEKAKILMATPIILSYKDRTYTPTAAEIGKWLAFQKQPDGRMFKLTPQLDSAKLKNYVQSISNQLDIDPVAKLINVENGVNKVSQEGKDGVAINRDPLTQALANAVTNQTPLTFEITDHVVPYKTLSTNFVTLDYPKYIEINLTKQRMWLWQDKTIIYQAPITSGAVRAGFGTVTGLFAIYYKTTNTRLIGYQYGYDYNVAVKYWMPFHGGYGLHDASWRNGVFGTPDYYYNGSHGCVNMPDAAAAFIYDWAPVGTPVYVHK